MADVNLDDVLNLEEEFYSKGYQEGQEKTASEQFLEGKVYGLQTGFQRFLVVGYIKGLVDEWEKLPEKAVQLHVKQLRSYVDDMSVSNDDKAVEQYEKKVLLARNKVRVIANITKTSDKVAKLDSLIKEVTGSLQVAENMDEMW